MKKIDFKKEYKQLFSASADEPAIIDVPKLSFLMVDGQGDPNTSREFQEAIQALYGLAFTIKFTLKHAKIGPEYSVPPLEGLWWTPGAKSFDAQNKQSWLWTLMIMQPNHITSKHLNDARWRLTEKKSSPAVSKVRLEAFQEGACGQIMHIGPYSREGSTIARLHQFVQEQGYKLYGKHHEIYMGDPRRTAPEKLKTILRHPIKQS